MAPAHGVLFAVLRALHSVLTTKDGGGLFQRLAPLIPAAVSTLVGGLTVRLGNSLPVNEAYQHEGPGLFSSNTKWQVVGNPFSGPGIVIEAVDMLFSTSTSPTPDPSFKTMKAVINQPYLLKGRTGSATGKCQRNTYFFNNETAEVVFRSGRVILGPAASGDGVTSGVESGTLQKASEDGAGTYDGVYGFSACAQLVGYGGLVATGEDCEAAARNVDPAAL
ncbi:Nn.00g039610.m01.CDS01 [Neocucurbitaria sp. VM-36]